MTKEDKSKKLNGLLTYIKDNKDNYKKNAKAASDKAAALSSIPVILRNKITGEIFKFVSLKDAYRKTGVPAQYLLTLKKNGKNGTKKWEIVDEEYCI